MPEHSLSRKQCKVDPTLKTGLLSVIEKVVNRTLSLDPVTLKRLETHQGAVIQIDCIEPEVQCWLWIESNGIRLAGYHEGDVDAVVGGTMASFMELAGRRQTVFSDVAGLSTSGDEQLINELGEIHKAMELDWEALVCRYLGDVAGHAFSEGFRSVSTGVQRLFQTNVDLIPDYLREELKVLPAKAAVDSAKSELDALQTDVEHLSEKITALEEQLKIH